MFERIMIGIIIGLVSGFVYTNEYESETNAKKIIIAFTALVIIAFIGSSFMFGAIYGVMAIGEIGLGYWFSDLIKSR